MNETLFISDSAIRSTLPYEAKQAVLYLPNLLVSDYILPFGGEMKSIK